MPACPRCRSDADARAIAGIAGEDGEVQVELSPLARLRCARGHDLIVPSAQEVDLATRAAIVVGARRGLGRHPVCGACGAPLTMPARRSERGASVVGDLGVTTVTLTAPFTRCGECGTDQLAPDRSRALTRAVARAIVGALTGTQDPPSGGS